MGMMFYVKAVCFNWFFSIKFLAIKTVSALSRSMWMVKNRICLKTRAKMNYEKQIIVQDLTEKVLTLCAYCRAEFAGCSEYTVLSPRSTQQSVRLSDKIKF